MAMAADGSSQYRNRNQIVKWITYTLLLLLRFFGIYQRGYIHPDEFFQGGQELFFGIDGNGRGGDANTYGYGVADEYVTKNVPWEFEPNHAVRSIVPPSFMTLLPLRLYVTLRDYVVRFQDDEFHTSVTVTMDDDEQLSGGTTIRKSWIDSYWIWTAPDKMNLSGREILLVPRLFMAVLSVVFLDGSLWILTSSRRPSDNNRMGISSSNGPPVEVLIMASSWPCLAFGVRPFTNSLEAMVLAFLLVIVAMMHEPRIDDSNNVPHSADKRMNGANNLASGSIPSLLLIGGICSIGVFVRFTFIFFAFPVVALFLWKRWRRWDGLGYKLMNVVYDGAWLALSFLLVSCAFIIVDTRYYSRQEDGTCTKLGCILNYIAPFNAFWYNSNRSNLAQHGLHPRLTHIAVNLPMLFGPLALVAYGSTMRRICHGAITTPNDTGCSVAKLICQWTIVFGLILLSCAPHQEPRFLLPLIVPLLYLYGREAVGGSRSLLTLWIVFNLACYIFFGWLHQGGLMQLLLAIGDLSSIRNGGASRHNPIRVFINYKTYLPPTFLTHSGSGIKRIEEVCKLDSSSKTCIHDDGVGADVFLDLKGAESTVLLAVLRKWLSCPCRELDVGIESFDDLSDNIEAVIVYLISPQAALLPLMARTNEAMIFDQYSIVPTWYYQLHITTEDWPAFEGSVLDFLGQLKLGMYAISCT